MAILIMLIMIITTIIIITDYNTHIKTNHNDSITVTKNGKNNNNDINNTTDKEPSLPSVRARPLICGRRSVSHSRRRELATPHKPLRPFKPVVRLDHLEKGKNNIKGQSAAVLPQIGFENVTLKEVTSFAYLLFTLTSNPTPSEEVE